MLRAIFLIGAAGLFAAASTGLAQPAEQASAGDAGGGDDIVVTGRTGEPPTQTEVTRQARAVTVPGAIRHSALPRFEGDRLCPGISGLRAEDAALMIDRIRVTAEELGLRMTSDDGTCRPNFVVAFVDDGQETIRSIQKGRYWLFGDMPPHELRELLGEEGPVRVWTATVMRTRDGMPAGSNQWMASSRIYLAMREDIVWVLVLFTRDDVRGKTLLQLADYATMRGLARTRPVESDGQPMDTILALFDPGATPPGGMTEFDRAYLGAIYDGLPNMPGITKVLGVNRQLRLQESEARAADAKGE
jgi:hypothetical protein